MPSAPVKPQWIILKRLLKQGILLGLIAATSGLLLGYFLVGRTIKAAHYGLNWASLTMFLFSGIFIAGQIRANPVDQMMLSRRSSKIPIEPVPWDRIVVV